MNGIGQVPQSKSGAESGMLAQTYNPNYLGGRDQENQSLRPAQAKMLTEASSQLTS
jgi:hypothetical protein